MIYFDRIGHLISDTSLDELHKFAQKLGLKREWFQDKQKYPHYDLTTEGAKRRAKTAGAVEICPKGLVRKLISLTSTKANLRDKRPKRVFE